MDTMSYWDSSTRVRDSYYSSDSALKRVLPVYKSTSKDQGSPSWSSSICYLVLVSFPIQSAFLCHHLSLSLSLSTLLSHHRLSGGAVTPFSLQGDLVLVSLVSANTSHVLQATSVVQVGQTVSKPLHHQGQLKPDAEINHVLKLTNVERAEHNTFMQGNNSGITLKISLSENQEDKLALLRTLQGVLYTTRDESLTNLLSKY
jgi:hypothetical protein